MNSRITQRKRRLGIYPKPWSKMPTAKYHKHPYLSSTGVKKLLCLSDDSQSDAFVEGTLVHEAIETYLLTDRVELARFNGLTPAKKVRCVNCVNQAVKYIGAKRYNIVEGSLFASREDVLAGNDHELLTLMEMAGVEGVRIQCDAYDNGVLTDWKTTSVKSPYEMNDAVKKYGYLISLAFYIRVMMVMGIKVEQCELVFLRKYGETPVILTYSAFKVREMASHIIRHHLDLMPETNETHIKMRGIYPTLN